MSDTVQLDLLPSRPNEIRAKIALGSRSFVIEESANVTLNQTHTPWLAPGLVYAMENNVPLRLGGAVDSKALENSVGAQERIASWWPEKFNVVEVIAESSADQPADGRGVGCFFSGGMDSFYSAVKNFDEVTHLIWVHGFDIFLSNTECAASTAATLRAAARELGKELIEVRSNIREFYESYPDGWGVGHGAALAHVALLLSDHLHTVLVPASHSAGNLQPWGTHPELDYRWSSTATQVVYDGLEATRVMKAALLKDNATAMSHLRVCFWTRSDIQNCGECQKCVCTVINLRIAGAGDRCTTLPRIDPIKSLERVLVDEPDEFAWVRENLDAMRDGGVQDPELERALIKALDRNYAQRAKARMFYGLTIAKVLFVTLRDKARR